MKKPFEGDSLGAHLAAINPIWAVSSMVAASGPKQERRGART